MSATAHPGATAGRRIEASPAPGTQPARRLAGKAFVMFGAFGLLAAFSRNAGTTMSAGESLVACIDIALGVLLLGDTEWPRLAAIIRSVLGVVSALAFPFVFSNASEQVALLALMVFFFFFGMLILLPGNAEKGRRWAGALVALVPYFLLKLLGGVQTAARTGFFETGDFLRAFFQMG